jgi:hypothetical protein
MQGIVIIEICLAALFLLLSYDDTRGINDGERKSQLSLLGLGSEIGHQHVADVAGGFVDVVAHALGADALADDVKV